MLKWAVLGALGLALYTIASHINTPWLNAGMSVLGIGCLVAAGLQTWRHGYETGRAEAESEERNRRRSPPPI